MTISEIKDAIHVLPTFEDFLKPSDLRDIFHCCQWTWSHCVLPVFFLFLHATLQARFYFRAGEQLPPNLSFAPNVSVTATVCITKTWSYTGVRATTKMSSLQPFCIAASPNIFLRNRPCHAWRSPNGTQPHFSTRSEGERPKFLS